MRWWKRRRIAAILKEKEVVEEGGGGRIMGLSGKHIDTSNMKLGLFEKITFFLPDPY